MNSTKPLLVHTTDDARSFRKFFDCTLADAVKATIQNNFAMAIASGKGNSAARRGITILAKWPIAARISHPAYGLCSLYNASCADAHRVQCNYSL